MIHIEDYVVRISYKRDVLFKVLDIDATGIARLKGIAFRIIADAPVEDLELAGGMRLTTKENHVMEQVQHTIKKILWERKTQFDAKKPALYQVGKVLHIDGDPFYLELCLKHYELLGIPAVGEAVAEMNQPKQVAALLQKHNPDILVLTGHDALHKTKRDSDDITQYKHSRYFKEAVIEARKTRTTKNHLVIFAGACQSYFEGLLEAGADYAASPNRVLIHALDPVFIVEKIAYCPFYQVLPIEQAIKNTITQFKGLGGYEILGVARRGGPIVAERKSEVYSRGGVDAMYDGLDEEAIEAELRRPIFDDLGDDERTIITQPNYIGNALPFYRTGKKDT